MDGEQRRGWISRIRMEGEVEQMQPRRHINHHSLVQFHLLVLFHGFDNGAEHIVLEPNKENLSLLFCCNLRKFKRRSETFSRRSGRIEESEKPLIPRQRDCDEQTSKMRVSWISIFSGVD